MDKRYQVFVSSTYADLKDERGRVIQTLMEMDCIPSGMELFPAADEEQWAFIKRVIDDCDYYLLIIGGRYGSTTPDGVSYTEKEYDYAIERGLKVIALLHENPDQIPVGKSDIDPALRQRLKLFRDKVAQNRLVRFWTKAEDLPGLVATSLSKTIKTYPAVGWVRSTALSNAEVLAEINQLRKENQELKRAATEASERAKPQVLNLAGLDEGFTVHGTSRYAEGKVVDIKRALTWRAIFSLISPYLLAYPADSHVKDVLTRSIFTDNRVPVLDDQDFQTIKIQLVALKVVEVQYTETTKGGMGLFWRMTPTGQALMIESRTIKAK